MSLWSEICTNYHKLALQRPPRDSNDKTKLNLFFNAGDNTNSTLVVSQMGEGKVRIGMVRFCRICIGKTAIDYKHRF